MKEIIEIYNDQDKGRFISRMQNAQVRKPWKIVISYLRDSRSNKQNRLYWMWVGCIIQHFIDHAGAYKTKLQIDAWLLDLFAPVEEFEVNGKTIHKQLSTSEMDTKQMAVYLNKIDTYCATELELYLPHPEDLWLMAVSERAA